MIRTRANAHAEGEPPCERAFACTPSSSSVVSLARGRLEGGRASNRDGQDAGHSARVRGCGRGRRARAVDAPRGQLAEAALVVVVVCWAGCCHCCQPVGYCTYYVHEYREHAPSHVETDTTYIVQYIGTREKAQRADGQDSTGTQSSPSHSQSQSQSSISHP